MTSIEPNWRQFEAAVANFIAAIGQGAKVTHDAKIPDAHTGFPRQRDVWIEWSILGHFPAKALISCKYWSKSLDQKDIDHFNGEFISSGAQIDIVYSKSGFNDRALEKSRTLGFHCCKLYEDEPAEIPEGLLIGHVYNFRPGFRLRIRGDASAYGFKQWREVLDLPFKKYTVFEAFVEAFNTHQNGQDEPKERWERSRLGSSFFANINPEGMPPLEIELNMIDRAYQARIEYTMLNGSYNMTAGAFLGSQATPLVDMESTHPGPGWVEVTDLPEIMPNTLLAMYMQADPKEHLLRFGKSPFPITPDNSA